MRTAKGKAIADVLAMTFAEAAVFFSAVPLIRKPVQFVCPESAYSVNAKN